VQETAGLLVAGGLCLLLYWVGRRFDAIVDAAARRRGFHRAGMHPRYYWPDAESRGTDVRRQLALSAVLLGLGVAAGVTLWFVLYR
jgi:hypothetical protein